MNVLHSFYLGFTDRLKSAALTKNLEEARTVRNRLIHYALSSAVPYPHVLRHRLDRAYIRIRP